MSKQATQSLQNDSLEVTLQDGSKKEYKNLSEDERQEITPKIIDGVNSLESKIQTPKYLRTAIIAGTRTAVETMMGYAAGRLYSQIN